MAGNVQQPRDKLLKILTALANLALILLCLLSIWLLFKNGYSWYSKILPGAAFLLNSWYSIIIPVVALLLIGGYTSGWFKWIGLQGYNKKTVATEKATVTSPPEKETTTTEYIPRKTLWDWMQLLLVPVMLTLIALVFNAQLNYTNQKNTEQQQEQATNLNKQQYQENQQLALDQQHETILENYLNNISDLLLKNNLHASKRLEEVRTVAQIKTLTALERLDPERKRIIILFLFEADLIGINNPRSLSMRLIIQLLL